jgi:hypothetical protein
VIGYEGRIGLLEGGVAEHMVMPVCVDHVNIAKFSFWVGHLAAMTFLRGNIWGNKRRRRLILNREMRHHHWQVLLTLPSAHPIRPTQRESLSASAARPA